MAPDKKFYETKEFTKLNKEWKKRLKQSGFEDLEETVPEYGKLQEQSARVFSKDRNSFNTRETIEEYFSIASDYLRDGRFSSKKEKIIWEQHCDGLSLGQIGEKLGFSKSDVARNVWGVRDRIPSYKRIKQ